MSQGTEEVSGPPKYYDEGDGCLGKDNLLLYNCIHLDVVPVIAKWILQLIANTVNAVEREHDQHYNRHRPPSLQISTMILGGARESRDSILGALNWLEGNTNQLISSTRAKGSTPPKSARTCFWWILNFDQHSVLPEQG